MLIFLRFVSISMDLYKSDRSFTMHKIMKGLQKDHHNLAKVLKIMELQLEHIADGDDSALALMLDASNYIQSYPDVIHHPKENKVFEVFKSRSKEEADALDTLTQQHKDMPDTTVKFKEMLDAAINGLGFISRGAVDFGVFIFGADRKLYHRDPTSNHCKSSTLWCD